MSIDEQSEITEAKKLTVWDIAEENAYWIYTSLLESHLPLDYFSNMVGCLIDQRIFYDLFR